jgi:hypothetical protein
MARTPSKEEAEMTGKNTLLAALTLLVLVGYEPARGQKSPLIEPEAMAALKAMGTYLRSLKAFQLEAVSSSEDVLEDGQKVQHGGVTNIVARIPDRIRVDVNSDRLDRLWVYDGKQFTLFARRVNYYATIPAPPTIGELADLMHEKYDLSLPFEDLFYWGGPKSQDAAITSAMFIGPSEIGGVTCGHYAFRQQGLDWQVWIQMGDFPLPRKLVLTTMTDEARPQYIATFAWNLAPAVNDAAFTFVPPKGAGKVVFAGVK